MADKQLFGANTGPQDRALFNGNVARSVFMPRPHSALPDHRSDPKYIPTDNAPQRFPSVVNFKISKQADYLEELYVYITTGQITASGGATYARFVRDHGQSMVESITIKNGSNNLYTIYPEHDRLKKAQYMCTEKKDNLNLATDGDLSVAERNVISSKAQYVTCIKLSTWFEHIPCHTLNIATIANSLTFQIRLNKPSMFLESDGTSVDIPFIDAELMCHFKHITGRERQLHTSLSLTRKGITYLIDDPQIESFIIPAGTTAYSTRITAVDQPVSEMQFRLVDADVMDDEGVLPERDQVDFERSDLHFNKIRLTGNGGDVIPELRKANTHANGHEKQKYHSCGTNNAFTYSFARDPQKKNCATGSINFQNLTNPKLFLEWENPLPVDTKLIITAMTHNWIQQQAGNLVRIYR